MTMYATVNSAGVATGFYSDAIHPSIPAGAIALTQAQYQAWIANIDGQSWSGTGLVAYTPPAVPVPLPPLAQAALDASDRTVLRCYEHGIAVPSEWQSYRAALRAIVSGTSTATALPAIPAFPAGS
jgi:hypothetical protein